MTAALHRDDEGSRLGMWLFLVTETTLFGGLFLVYAVLRHRFPGGFRDGGARMNVVLGVLNTGVLLTSSLTVALAQVALARRDRAKALAFGGATLALGAAFLVVKGFEWGAKFHHGLVPGSPPMLEQPQGVQAFFALYFVMTGLHGIHVLAGLGIFSVLFRSLARGRLRAIQLENAGLFWHLVDVIWIFLLPLFYLAA